MVLKRTGPEDEIIARLLAARDRGGSPDELLGRVLMDEAAPILTMTVRARLPEIGESEREEVEASALLRLTEILQRLVAGDSVIEIRNFRAYVGATGANACRAWLRDRYPERTRLANQLRYVLGHDPALAVWPVADGSTRCGLASWRGREERDFPPHAAAAAAGFSRTPTDFDAGELATGGAKRLPALLRHYFLFRGRPARMNELLHEIAGLLGIADRLPLSLAEPAADDDELPTLEIAEERPGALRQLEDREYLETLWSEVIALPSRQRTALLLNLRDDQGRDRLRLFPLTGVVDLPGLARSLELEVDELRALLPELPLEDRAIAERLGATPRQVINLRKSARARLARRLGRGA